MTKRSELSGESRAMIQSQHPLPRYRYRLSKLQRSPLLQQHPILLPALFLLGAIATGMSGFFSDSIFPLLSLIGVPSILICLSLAFVLGIVGILIGIISLIESMERQIVTHLKVKEQSYVHRN